MNVKWDAELKNWQRTNPVVESHKNIKGIKFKWNEQKAREVLVAKGHQLKTWGGNESTSEPHWIGVTGQTPIHTDPRYPRYSGHLVLKVDDFVLRGIDKEELKLENNMLYLVDVHSPHQLFAKSKDAVYYIAVSIDHQEQMPIEYAREKLIKFANETPINLNPERISH